MAVTRDTMGHLMAFVENASPTTVDVVVFTERNRIEVPQVYMVNEVNQHNKLCVMTHDYEFCTKQGTFVYEARKIEGISYKRSKTD